jgi:hypothetical protein
MPSDAMITDELPPLPSTDYVCAREGDGYEPDRLLPWPAYDGDQMHAYARAAIAAERARVIEECARACDLMLTYPPDDYYGPGYAVAKKDCARAIRALAAKEQRNG